MGLDEIGRGLEDGADDVARTVIDQWGEIGTSEPWLSLPDDLDQDHLPELIRLMAAASLKTGFDRDLCRDLVRCAAGHGEHRADQGFAEPLIYREYHLLRRALWRRLKDAYGESAESWYASMRLDTAASLATAAALNGMHRGDLERRRRWPAILDDLLDEWPFPR